MSVPQRHTLATSAAAVATALTLGIAITPTAGAGSVDLPETSSAGSGSSAGSAPGSTTGSGALDDLLDRMRTQIHTVTDSEFVRGPLAHAILDLNPDTPVVVLGAQINEDCSRPEVLQDRLDAATRLLASHPRNPVIVTGGRSDRCPSITEAEAMTQGLRDRGVRNRIVLENNAWNTLQNVEYTAPMIRKLGGTAVVVTSDPHYLRALANYRDAGIRAFGWVGGTG
ncbi:YdcF family protein [Corynebacterium nuruki]|uniref:YdcF family protein n=1 Tax=Corynebacterium nuruki TaxID=1032851 RepID=UPI000A058E69|nr:YdcF family protein [Corynebacterium nuruki]